MYIKYVIHHSYPTPAIHESKSDYWTFYYEHPRLKSNNWLEFIQLFGFVFIIIPNCDQSSIHLSYRCSRIIRSNFQLHVKIYVIIEGIGGVNLISYCSEDEKIMKHFHFVPNMFNRKSCLQMDPISCQYPPNL